MKAPSKVSNYEPTSVAMTGELFSILNLAFRVFLSLAVWTSILLAVTVGGICNTFMLKLFGEPFTDDCMLL